MKEIIFTSMLLASNLTTFGQSKLSYNTMYVYDINTDTIIKDYELFKEFKKLLPQLNSQQNDSLKFVPMPGSNFTESLVFYELDGGTRANSIYFDEQKHINDHKAAHQVKSKYEFLHLVTITEDSIFFVYGDYINDVATWYSGKIYSDSLVFTRKSTFKGDDIHEAGAEILRTYKILNSKDIFKEE